MGSPEHPRRSSPRTLVVELVFSSGLVILSELVVLSTHWHRFWVLVAVFTAGNVLWWWLTSRRSSSRGSLIGQVSSSR